VSLILDALNRARQGENAVPGLATHHPVQALSARRRQYLLWAALGIAVAVIAALVVDRFRAPPAPPADIGAPVAELSRNIGSAVASVTTELEARAAAAEQSSRQASATAAPAAGEPATAPAPATELPAATAAVSPPSTGAPASARDAAEPAPAEPDAAVAIAQAAQSQVQGQVQGQGNASGDTATPPAAAGTAAGNPVQAAAVAPPNAAPAVRDEAVDRLYQNRDLADVPAKPRPAADNADRQPAAANAADSRHSAEVERILREARDEMENASLDEHPAPFLANLSQRTKDAIPTLFYQRHDYSSNAAQSSVTLNGNTVQVGGSVQPGLKVEEILPDSVVLNYQGTQFRLRALNSWVNL